MAKAIAKLELTGFDEVTKTFETLPEKLKGKALRPALRAGAKLIMAQAKVEAPKDSGDLIRGIKLKAQKRSRKSFGTNIQTGTRAKMGISPSAKWYYPSIIEHGSRDGKIAPNPFMRRALSKKRSEATNEVGRTLGKKQDEIIRKAKKVR